MRFYWPIAKVDGEQRMVWGYASTEAEDEQGETVTRAALAAALDDYMRFANIREMHRPSAVGVATEAAVDNRGLYLGAKIVDPDAWAKVVEGVYKGFSIGGRVTARDPADRSVITGLSLTEISVVDRPANPEAVFDCWKRAAISRTPIPDMPPSRDDPHASADYADPGYQPDARPRYQLDGERRIRAAWAFIHMPHNARRYTPDQLAHVKARIVAAWRARIGPAGPPAANAAAPDAARKGTGLADCLQAIVDQLCDVIDAVTDGQLAPTTGYSLSPAGGEGWGEGADAMSGRRHPHPVVAAASTTLSRAAGEGFIAKFADAILPRLDALQKRVEDIAQTPLPPQTAARDFIGLAKRDDGYYAAPPSDDIVATLARMTGDERTLLLIKAAHAAPIRR